MSDKKRMRYNPDEDGYKAVRFQIRASQKTLDKLEKLAQKKGMTKSEVIRELIEKAK